MSKIKLDYADKSEKFDNYSVKSQHNKAGWFIGLLCMSLAWGSIAVHVIIESTK